MQAPGGRKLADGFIETQRRETAEMQGLGRGLVKTQSGAASGRFRVGWKRCHTIFHNNRPARGC